MDDRTVILCRWGPSVPEILEMYGLSEDDCIITKKPPNEVLYDLKLPLVKVFRFDEAKHGGSRESFWLELRKHVDPAKTLHIDYLWGTNETRGNVIITYDISKEKYFEIVQIT